MINFLDSAVDLRQNKFIAKNTKIEVHKDVFGNSENDQNNGASSGR